MILKVIDTKAQVSTCVKSSKKSIE